jgi:Trk K+ transport system NAD-binding subunit
VQALDEEGIRSVVIDPNEDRINELALADLRAAPLGIIADASRSEVLETAGIKHHWCAGVIALADDDSVNLTVAITTQLMNPKIRLIARAETKDAESNILSFGANEVINPFETFAARLALALHSPSLHILFEWMTGVPGETLREPFFLGHGRWVICGFGRFGRAVYDHLADENVELQVVEADREKRDVPSGSVLGRPTEASSLKKAGIEDAIGIIAGTDNDADNLSTLMTARELNPDLFMVARQNQQHNAPIFDAAGNDLIMQRGNVVAHKIFALIRTPLLGDFLRIVARFKNEKANILVSRIIGVVDEEIPELWEFEITEKNAPALFQYLEEETVIVSDLTRDPRQRELNLSAIPLFLKRGKGNVILPEENRILRQGDRLLMCGSEEARNLMSWMLNNINVLEYAATGEVRPDGYVWRWIHNFKYNRSLDKEIADIAARRAESDEYEQQTEQKAKDSET